MTAPVINWRWLRPRNVNGIALFVLILIRPGLGSRQAMVVEHERVHIRQQRRHWWVGFAWRYLSSRRWQLMYEAEAYAVDYRAGRPIDDILTQLQKHGGRKISREECRRQLMRFI